MSQTLGRYELETPLGKGGMAEVWLGRRRSSGGIDKRVVIKRVLRERQQDTRFLEMFVREAQISMQLSHKNVVPVFDFGRVGTELFLVMDYVPGLSLQRALQLARDTGASVAPTLICYIGFEVCQALDYVHRFRDRDGKELQIAHRDITPGNILLSSNGEVKVSDFGLALTTEHVQGEAIVGTPGYMAPEQAQGDEVGRAADLYALGLILYEALLGQRVRSGTSEEQMQQALQPLPELASTETDSWELARICQRATRLDPGERYPDAGAFLEDLDACLLELRGAEEKRRPMADRLGAWVRDLEAQNREAKPIRGTRITGAPLTFLEHGAGPIIEAGTTSERSMAVTVGPAENKVGTRELKAQTRSLRGRTSNDEVDGRATTERDKGVRPSESTSKSDSTGDGEPTSSDVADRARRRWWAAGLVVAAAGAFGARALLTGNETLDARRTPTVEVATIAVLADANDRRSGTRLALDASLPDAGEPDAAPASAPDAGARRHSSAVNASQRAEAGTGTVRVSSSPWATVTVGGQTATCPETPCSLVLPSGSHELVLRNPVAGLSKRVRVDVIADETIKVFEVLEASTP